MFMSRGCNGEHNITIILRKCEKVQIFGNNEQWKLIAFSKKLTAISFKGMLANSQFRIFCLPVFYLKT
jgi:hypothetical protein